MITKDRLEQAASVLELIDRHREEAGSDCGVGGGALPSGVGVPRTGDRYSGRRGDVTALLAHTAIEIGDAFGPSC